MSHVHDAVIVGAGFGGMGAAIQLRRMGYDDLLILEREDDLGGTWHVEHFGGDVVHTTRWDEDVELEGKRIGIIGTGATAVQAIPELAKVAGHLYVFQRTPSTIDVRDQRLTTAEDIEGWQQEPGWARARRGRFARLIGRRALQANDDYLAGKVYLSPNYLRVLFKEKMGCTVHEYLTKARLTRALELLSDKTLKIHDVSRQVGYDNTSYFCSFFYKTQGVTPNEYRKKFL